MWWIVIVEGCAIVEAEFGEIEILWRSRRKRYSPYWSRCCSCGCGLAGWISIDESFNETPCWRKTSSVVFSDEDEIKSNGGRASVLEFFD